MNYFMLDGKKIKMSEETAKSLREQQKPKLNIVTKFPTRQSSGGYINGKWAMTFRSEEKGCEGFCKKAGHHSNAFLCSNNGTWYDENGNEIKGYLFFKPKGE